jgi:hypothetical protein
MRTVSTPEQLADAIESLVASYIDEVRQAVQHAVERSLSGPMAAGRRSKKRSHDRSPAPGSTSKRRTAAQLEQTCEQLCTLVRARPGESIAVLAEEMGESALTLQRPMAKLRTEGRVRSVGQRHMMRYFPAVVRAASAKG